MLGIGIDTSIASANEVEDAIAKQDSGSTAKKVKKVQETFDTEPPVNIMDKAVAYIKSQTDKKKAFASIMDKYESSLTEKQIAGSRSLFDDQTKVERSGIYTQLDQRRTNRKLFARFRDQCLNAKMPKYWVNTEEMNPDSQGSSSWSMQILLASLISLSSYQQQGQTILDDCHPQSGQR